MKNKKHIFAGPLPGNNSYDGTTISFLRLITWIDQKNDVIDINRRNSNSLFVILRFINACIKAVIQKKELSLHGTANNFRILGNIILFFHIIFGLRYNLRKFAGNFDAMYEKMDIYSKMIIRNLLKRSQANFFQTRYLVDYFKRYNNRTFWFTNYRQKTGVRTPEQFSGKFIFVGWVSKEKGIETLLSLDKYLKNGWTIDIYGKLVDIDEERLQLGSIRYRGIIENEKVSSVMSQYNGLILPSYREGYPGVIIEAYSVGLPVISTNLRSINEIVDDSSGILVEPGDVMELKNALYELEKKYSDKREGAIKKFDLFDEDKVLAEYLTLLSG